MMTSLYIFAILTTTFFLTLETIGKAHIIMFWNNTDSYKSTSDKRRPYENNARR